MSLNGLEVPDVIEAYQTALTEAGGWFLLKYIERDVVALLGRGTGGVVEIRATIDGYGEKSPLYGFLQYRRRKIVLRYVPESISRLVQARITVHFQSVLDKFSPHDTVFTLSVSAELTETALSSACLLHTASGSMTSSSSSLRRRKLGEITEDAEESSGAKEDNKPSHSPNHKRRESMYSRASEATAVPALRDADGGSSLTRSMSQISTNSNLDKALPLLPHGDAGSRTNGVSHRHPVDEPSYAQSRKSSQSVRPSLGDIERLYRPKVKLGPRPSMDPNGRPRTAGSMKSHDFSLVASLPAGVRSARKSTGGARSRSQPDLPLPPVTPPKMPPVPSLLLPPPPINLGPISRNGPSSPRSIMSVPASIGMSPEKQRLMRALQLRKKQMEKRADEAQKKEADNQQQTLADVPEDDQIPESTAEETAPAQSTTEHDPLQQSALEDIAPSQNTAENETPDQSIPEDLTTTKESEPTATSDQSPNSIETQNEPASDQGTADNSEVTTKDEKLISPDPSQPDSAVAMVDVGSNVEHDTSAESPDYSKSPEPRLGEGLTSTPSFDSGIGASQPDDDDESQVSEPTPAQTLEDKLQEAPQQCETDEAPVPAEEDRLKVTEFESVADFQDSASPTPRANPLATTFAEAMGESIKPELPLEVVEASSPEASPPEVAPAEGSAPEELAAETPPREVLPVEVPPPQESQSQAAPSPAPELTAQPESRIPAPSTDSRTTPLNHKSSLRQRRQGLLEPIQIPTADFSDEDNLLSDDSLMEELKSASVQEAKPIALPRSAKNDGFASPLSSRAISNPTATSPDVQALPAGRSASGTYFENQRPIPVMVARKVNVSSGISKRIKALEMFSSSREASPAPPAPAQPPVSTQSKTQSQFDKFRKRASMSQTSLPPPAEPIVPSPKEPENTLPFKRPERRESVSVNTRARAKSSTISVTARIVRDPCAQPELPRNLTEPSILNLQRSELTVEQDGQPEASHASRSPSIVIPERPRLSTSSSSPSALTGPATRSEAGSRRLSTASFSKHERTLSPSPSEHTVEEGKEERKESRKSRILRRMSSITSNSRRGLKNALSPSLKEEEVPAMEITFESLPEARRVPAIDIGEVNVQFPDTLLWKRRFMRIDDDGYLVLTPGTIDGNARNLVKKYHLSEFRIPSLPDQDRQELPHSIVLDFLNGNTLQCACESRQGQTSVLRTLIDAHCTYRNVET